jgi:hypothetical protein
MIPYRTVTDTVVCDKHGHRKNIFQSKGGGEQLVSKGGNQKIILQIYV